MDVESIKKYYCEINHNIYWNILPAGVILEIINYLTVDDIKNLCRTNKELYKKIRQSKKITHLYQCREHKYGIFKDVLIRNNVTYVDMSQYHTCFITLDADLYTMGLNINGIFGFKTDQKKVQATKVLSNIKKVICTSVETVALDHYSNVYYTGQIINSNVFIKVMKSIKDIYDQNLYIVRKDNKVLTFFKKQMKINKIHIYSKPVQDDKCFFESVESLEFKENLYELNIIINEQDMSDKVNKVEFYSCGPDEYIYLLMNNDNLIFLRKNIHVKPKCILNERRHVKYYYRIGKDVFYINFNNNIYLMNIKERKPKKINLDTYIVMMKSCHHDIYLLTKKGQLLKTTSERIVYNNNYDIITSNVRYFEPLGMKYNEIFCLKY